MTNHEFWYISRAAGFTAYLLIFASVALGLLQNTRLAERLVRRNTMFDMHRFVSLLAVGFSAVHIYILLGDRYIGFNVWQLSIPFISPYRGWQTAFGSLAFYSMVVVIGSFYLRGKIGFRAWRILHYVTFLMFAMVTFHGLTAGSDTDAAWARAIYLGAALGTAALLAYRLRRSMPEDAPARRLRFASGAATLGLIAAMLWYMSADRAPDATLASSAPAGDVAPAITRFQNSVSGTITVTRGASGASLHLDGQGIGDQPMRLVVDLEQASTTSAAGHADDDDDDDHEGRDDDGGDDHDRDSHDDDDEYERGATRLVRNDARLFAAGAGSAICVGQVTQLDDDALSLTCDGVGAWAGSRIDISARFEATQDGAFRGAMTGAITRAG